MTFQNPQSSGYFSIAKCTTSNNLEQPSKQHHCDNAQTFLTNKLADQQQPSTSPIGF